MSIASFTLKDEANFLLVAHVPCIVLGMVEHHACAGVVIDPINYATKYTTVHV